MSLPLRLEDVLPAAVVSSYSDPAAARPLRRHVHPASSSGGDSSDSNSISISGMPSPPRLVLCAQEPGAADGEFVAALMLCRLLREDPPTTTTAPAAAPSSSYAAGTAPASRVARRGRVKCLIFNHSKQVRKEGSRRYLPSNLPHHSSLIYIRRIVLPTASSFSVQSTTSQYFVNR